MKRIVGFGAIAGAVVVLAVAMLTRGVSAHAPYASSTPAAGAVVSTSPASVVINFEENIQKTSGSFGVAVASEGGASVTASAATASGDKQLTVALQPNLSAGRYVVNWNNTSADDGDPLSGAFSFYVNTQPTAAQLAADQQLAAIEANQLATATAQAVAQSTQTAQAGAAPSSTTPAHGTTPAAGAALPRTGTGSASGSDLGTSMIVVLALGALGLAVTAFAVRRRRSM